MKRMHGVILAMAAVAFAATTALADEPQSTPATSPAPASTSAKSMHHTKAAAKTPKTDLNSAAKEDLMKLPGVDDATADKIIASRPYTSKSELVKKNVLTQEEMKKIDAHVMAKAPAKEAAPKK